MGYVPGPFNPKFTTPAGKRPSAMFGLVRVPKDLWQYATSDGDPEKMPAKFRNRPWDPELAAIILRGPTAIKAWAMRQ